MLKTSLQNYSDSIKRFIGQDDRSRNANKNSLIGFVCKGISIIISFFLLPLTIGYVNSDTYGIWVTISSMVAWLSVLDIGMGNGLRNKFVKYRTQGDNKMVKKKAYSFIKQEYQVSCFCHF